MILSKQAKKRIEWLLAPGVVLEVHLDENGHIGVYKKTGESLDFNIPPCLTDLQEATMVEILLRKPEREPVSIASLEVPAGYYVTGIKGTLG